MGAMARLFLLFVLTGCIPPATPVAFRAAPPTPQQIASCESTRRAHNWWVALGVVFGAGAGASGVSTIISDDSGVKLGIGIASAASGVLSSLFTTLAGFATQTYAIDNCQTILQQAATK
jgi:hypothetical protein